MKSSKYEEELDYYKTYKGKRSDCDHCWHPFTGAIWMVIPSGHIIEECCKCPLKRTVHAAHAICNKFKITFSIE